MCKKLICLVSFILVLSMASSVRAILVGHWTLDDGSGTTVSDSTGNGNDGAFNGDLSWIAGIKGGALDFDGTAYVDCGNDPSLDITGPFSSTIWIRPGTEGGGDSVAPLCKADAGLGWSWQLRFAWGSGGQDNIIGWQFNTTGGSTWLYIGQELPIGEWYHIAAAHDGTTVKLYLDGVETDSQPMTGFASSPSPFLIGSEGWGFHWIGALDDVRLYDHGLSPPEVLGAMQGNVPPTAWGPTPADGALHPDTWVQLSWKPGPKAASHDVYFDDNFDDVNAGAESTFHGNQAGTFIVVGFPGFPFPDGLIPGTTYYWRIDEVNDTEPNSPWKGDVWSFSIPPKSAYASVPADGGDSVALDVELSWTPGFGAKLHTVYFGDNFDDVNNATGGQTQGTATYTPGQLELAKTYYWRVDEFDVVETHKGNVWSFTTEGAVGSPVPSNGAVDVPQATTLSWTAGVFADSHQVYFGTDKEAVKNADTSSPEYKGAGNLGSESYDAGQLEWNTTYYWRIDELNNANANSPWTGPLWSFTTANFLVVDDMESYNDINEGEPASNRIYLAWADGFDNPTINGSVVGHADAPFAEQSIVHGGNQSMPMAYNNAVGKSEATLTLTSNRDWTVNGINTLTIWFRGEAANAAEPMYVALNDSAVVTNDNPDAAQKTSWTQWNIDLQAFADQGVNLANVTTITLGLGNRSNPVAGGSGMMYFDDIRLYALP